MSTRTGRGEVKGLSTVDRAARVLELLADQPVGLGLGDLAAALGVKPQTAQTLLRSLERHEMVFQPERGGPYQLGPQVHKLSQRWLSRCDRVTLARAPMATLARLLNETVYLGELRGDRVLGLLEIHADQALSVSHGLESRDEPHVMATGKVLLAHLPEDRREALLARLDLRQRAPRSLTSLEDIRRELEGVRTQGYAVTREEAAAGVCALAVPLRDPLGRVVAALGVTVPAVRFASPRPTQILDGLKRCAAEIERRWGA